MELSQINDRLIYTTYIDNSETLERDTPKGYTAYDLYSMKVWVLRELRKLISEGTGGTEGSKIEVYSIVHGIDERTPIKVVTRNLTPELYDQLDVSFSLYHDISSGGFYSYVILDVYLEGNKILLPVSLTAYINEYIKQNVNNFRYIPVISSDDKICTDEGHLLPISWVFGILKFMKFNVPWKLTSQGLLLNLESQVEPTDTLSGIYTEILRTLTQMYYAGYVASPSKDLISSWNLIPVGQDGLYVVTSFDHRLLQGYVSIVDFLLSREYDPDWIERVVGENVLIRHMVTSVLKGYSLKMIGKNVRVTVKNYDDAIVVLRLIDDVLNTSYPDLRVDVTPMQTSGEVNLTDTSVEYSTDDSDRPWYLSTVSYISES